MKPKRIRVLVIGYFGRKNIGDDIMLRGFTKLLMEMGENIRVAVAVHDEKNITEKVDGCFYFETSERFEYIKQIAQSNYVIWAGGTCLYDSGTEKGNRGLRDLHRIQVLSKIFRSKFVFFGVGIGGVTDKVRPLIARLIDSAEFVFFRDRRSLSLSNSLSVGTDIKLTGDLAFTMLPELLSYDRVRKTKGYVTFSGVYDQAEPEKAAVLLNTYCRENSLKVVFLPCHEGDRSDDLFHEKVSFFLDVEYERVSSLNVKRFCETLANSNFHFGVRLHSIVLADMFGVPNIAFSYSPKVRSYIEETGGGDVNGRVIDDWGEASVDTINSVCDRYVQPVEMMRRQWAMVGESVNELFF